MELIALQFQTSYNNYQDNLDKLSTLIEQTPENSFILAPELCLTGYSYDHLDDAATFSNIAIETLLKLSASQTIALTLTVKEDSNFYNRLHIFHNKKIIYTQDKVKLFTLNDEDKFFKAGDEKDIQIIEIDGLKIATLICFELRFVDLWKQLQGADIILVPAMWGALRKQNYESLTNALAITNQCYVIASDSSNDKMASGSGIISPFGDEFRDDSKEIISMEFDQKEIKKMRRYLNTGI